MNPEEEAALVNDAPTEGLTPDDLASIAVDPSQAPATSPSTMEGSGLLGALMAFAVLVAGIGKKLQMVLQAGHDERMKAIALAKDVDPQAVSELKVSLEGELMSAPPSNEDSSEAAPDAPVVQAGAPCACADNQAVLANLQKRVKVLENWKKRGVRSSKSG
jgi:hypothetical protein